MSFAAVQKHVAVLERAGLVDKRATGASSACARTSGDRPVAAPGPRRARGDLARAHPRMADLLDTPTTKERAMTVTRVDSDTEAAHPHLIADFDGIPSSRCGSCGPIRASSSAGGGRRPTRRRWRSTTSRRAAR